MKHSLSRRTVILCATFGAAILIVLAVWVIRLSIESNRYRNEAAISSVRAFQVMTESVDQVNTDLKKCVYSTSPGMISALCTKIYGETSTAAQALGELPYANIELENTVDFVNKVGDYALSVSKNIYTTNGYTEDDLENMKELSKAASILSAELNELSNQLNDGTVNLSDATAVEQRLANLTEDQELFTGSTFESIEADFPELPTLIYDGPFSEHLQSRSAAMLEREQTVTAQQARQAAADFLGIEPSALTNTSDVNGEIPCYVFDEVLEDCTTTVEVTKQGGYILSINCSRTAGPQQLSHEEGVKAAQAFLKKHDITSMEESYYIDRDNCLTVNFASVQDDVLCYPDLIKVEVALDTGSIVGFESAGYLMNHIRRENLSPAVAKEDAEDAVSSELQIKSSRLTLIPTEGQYEKLCWEFLCKTADGDQCLVYVGAQSGQEEQILLLLEDESGALTK